MPRLFRPFLSLIIFTMLASAAHAQTAPAPAYGMPIGLENAKKAAAAAISEARKNNFTMAVAVVSFIGIHLWNYTSEMEHLWLAEWFIQHDCLRDDYRI